MAASVLSGNRNFEARVHVNVKANFLMSPPLVVAYALAGTVLRDLDREAIGQDREGREVLLRDIWPTQAEVAALLEKATDPDEYRKNYARLDQNPAWNELAVPGGALFKWDARSTYVQEPPYFMTPPRLLGDVTGARALAIFGDSITTDHISPAGSIQASSPAGRYLLSLGVKPADFNSYGSRRGNDRVMVRGTFANVRIRNSMVPGREGGVTAVQPSGGDHLHLRRRHRVRDPGHSTGGDCRARVRHRKLPRLGGQGDDAARGAGGGGQVLRADPPRQPGGHGGSPAPVPGRRLGGDARARRHRDLRRRGDWPSSRRG